jgi:truncated hemoglobin YjbI
LEASTDAQGNENFFKQAGIDAKIDELVRIFYTGTNYLGGRVKSGL